MRGRTAYLVGTAAALLLSVFAAPAQADHHEVRIAEVFPGADDSETIEYVQLEMTSSGQRFFGGTNSSITLQGPTGTQTLSAPVNADVTNGERGRRVLIGVADLETTFGAAGDPDFEWLPGNYLDSAGGAACFISGTAFGSIDCVSWGSFSGSTADPTGGNTPPIDNTDALVRDRPSCGPGLIDSNHPLNWGEDAPDPFNNAQSVATGTPCPNTTLTKTPKKKTTKRLARFEFIGTLGADEFVCKLDSAPFADCESPFRKRVKVGKHTFRVRVSGDPSPASFSWKVKRKRR